MEITVPGEVSLTRARKVSEDDTAFRYGSGLIPVFATPAMVGFMEATAQEALQPFLPPGYITLGIEINVKHMKATPVGMMVHCNATLVSQEGKLFVFRISAWDEQGEIGEAQHKRYMVNADRFMAKLTKGEEG